MKHFKAICCDIDEVVYRRDNPATMPIVIPRATAHTSRNGNHVKHRTQSIPTTAD